MIDTAHLRFAKPRPRLLEKRERRSALMSIDRAERKKCHQRSGGRCEVIEAKLKPESSAIIFQRCRGRASQNHHLLGGHGRRNIGDSILAEHRLDVCAVCHSEINAGVLRVVPPPDNGPALYRFAATVRYWKAA